MSSGSPPHTSTPTAHGAKGWVLIALALALLLVWAWGIPYMALYRMGSALQAKDAALIERYVDFPRFRASLEDELRASLRARHEEGSRMARVGARLAEAALPALLDALLTPEGIVSLLEGGEALARLLPEGAWERGEGEQSLRHRLYPTSFTDVRLDLHNGDQRLVLYFERSAYHTSMRLTGLELPR